MRCATCPRELSATDRTMKCVRCADCRKTSPGRPPTPRARRTWNTAIAPHRRSEPPSTPGPAWWTSAPREGFTAQAITRRG